MNTPAPAEWLEPLQLWRAMQLGQACYLDVRTSAEFIAGHPAGAAHVALYEDGAAGRRLQPEFVAHVRALRATLPPTCVIVVGCRTGARSGLALQVLRASAIAGLAHFPGGWAGGTDSWGRVTAVGWLASGLPTATSDAIC